MGGTHSHKGIQLFNVFEFSVAVEEESGVVCIGKALLMQSLEGGRDERRQGWVWHARGDTPTGQGVGVACERGHTHWPQIPSGSR